MKPDAETHVLTVIWSFVPLPPEQVCSVFLETTTVPDPLSIATMDLMQLNIDFELLFSPILSTMSYNRSKCCFHTITLPIFDLPQSMFSAFALVKLCLNLKFLYHLFTQHHLFTIYVSSLCIESVRICIYSICTPKSKHCFCLHHI